MSDIFISYSRKDAEFVGRLHEALKTRDRDTWVDWEDIPVTAEWWNEITAAIEATDTFLFVITPESVRSKVCFDEIDHAAQNHKRIVPILHNEVTEEPDQERMHPAVVRHNWIFMRDEDDFDTAFARLLSAIDTDLDHVRMHTRLLVRAKEWDKIGRKSSPLLRGQELRMAETWLTTASGKEPKPIDLHAKYILESRRATNRLQRSLLAGVTGVLLITIFLLGLTSFFYQRSETHLKTSRDRGTAVANQAATALSAQKTSAYSEMVAQTQATIAENERATAVYQGGVSQSIALAAQAQLELDGRYPERSVLLALDALESYPYTWQAEQALGKSIQNYRLLHILSQGVSESAVWSPDGTRIITTSWSGTASMWDADTGQELYSFPEQDAWVIGAAWSPDGRFVATTNGGIFATDSPVHIWDATTGIQLRALMGHAEGVNSVAWSPDGQSIVTGSSDDTAKIWDVTTGQEQLAFSGHTDIINSVSWSPDGSRIATASRDGTARIWSVDEGIEPLVVVRHAFEVSSVDWSPDSQWILTSGFDGTAVVWDATTGEELLVLTGHPGGVIHATWSLDGTRIATSGFDGAAKVWTIETQGSSLNVGDTLRLIGHTSQVQYVSWSPDNTRVVTASRDGTATVWDVSPEPNVVSLDGGSSIWNLDWSPEGSRIVTESIGGRNSAVIVWDIASRQEQFLLADRTNSLESLSGVSWSPDGDYILAADENGQITIWDAATGEVQLTLESDSNGGETTAWSPDTAKIIGTGPEGKLTVWDVTTGESMFTLSVEEWSVRDVAWSPDGTVIAIGGDTVEIVDAETGAQLLSLATSVEDIAWSPDGKYLVTSSRAGIAEVWVIERGDTMQGALERTLIGHTDAVFQAAWSPDGARIATASWDNTVRIWDRETGIELFTLPHNQRVHSIAWSSDGTYIVTGGDDGNARIWRAFETTDDLVAYSHTCCVARELTPEERIQFNLPVRE